MSRSPELILVVDDDASIRAAMRELLETEGYDVTEAANGLAALGKLRAGLRPAVILLDLMMPVMDGWDLRTEQLRDPELAAIPVLIVTAAGFSLESVTAQFGSHRLRSQAAHAGDPPGGSPQALPSARARKAPCPR